MNPLNLFRSASSASAAAGQAHMTWATSRTGRTLSRAGAALKRRLWIWPILAVVLLAIVGYGVRSAIESTMKDNLASGLQTLLKLEVAMLGTWFEVQESTASTAANRQDVRELIYPLLEAGDTASSAGEPDGSVNMNVHQQLTQKLGPVMSANDYLGYFVADQKKRIVSSTSIELVGRQEIPEYDEFLTQALDGQTTTSAPYPSVSMRKDDSGRLRNEIPTMVVCVPIRDPSFRVVGALTFWIKPEKKFTQILQLGRLGETGETYAVNRQGTMVSNSRFDVDLIVLGVIPDWERSQSMLQLQVRDPRGNLTEGFRPTVRRSEMPLTKMAAEVTAGRTGVDVDGYRDYRGVPVVGAWTWMPKYGLGVATEMDVSEAFRPLTILRRTFWALFALLAISSVAIFIFTLVVAKLQHEAQKAVIESKQLGQYKLEEKLGSGGMGVVYRGHHAMMRRPTAIKMLELDKLDETAIARFEREVQITCLLNHPNTIAIYDYGRTPEGIFYYAMEYLDGVNLQTLVDSYGPLSEGRIIRILQQVCGSLYEAHTQGLVHRDIKPANVMLTRRGGEPDVVKVLDFGLVKSISDESGSHGSAGALTGTPLYMSPESIQTPLGVDHRSDIYAVGAVGYFLLTGQPVFQAQNLAELCQQHIDARPMPPSQRLGRAVCGELENAILACLEKSRAKRPQTARDLAHLLSRSPQSGSWTQEDADAWWNRHERGEPAPAADPGKKTVGGYDQTIDTSGPGARPA